MSSCRNANPSYMLSSLIVVSSSSSSLDSSLLSLSLSADFFSSMMVWILSRLLPVLLLCSSLSELSLFLLFFYISKFDPFLFDVFTVSPSGHSLA